MTSHRAILVALPLALLMIGCDGDSVPTSPYASGETVAQASAEASALRMPAHCPTDLHRRSAEEVLESHRAAIAAEDYDAAICNYAPDAQVIADGGIDVGHDEIRASLEFFNTVFQGTQPIVVQQIAVPVDLQTTMVRLLFTIDTPCIIVPDGIDTYIIRRGLIQAQTGHALPVFPCI